MHGEGFEELLEVFTLKKLDGSPRWLCVGSSGKKGIKFSGEVGAMVLLLRLVVLKVCLPCQYSLVALVPWCMSIGSPSCSMQ